MLVTAVQPVNRYFSADSSKLEPDLECLVGMDSADISELYKVFFLECSVSLFPLGAINLDYHWLPLISFFDEPRIF